MTDARGECQYNPYYLRVQTRGIKGVIPRRLAPRNPYDRAYDVVTSQGFFAPCGAQNDMMEVKPSAISFLADGLGLMANS